MRLLISNRSQGVKSQLSYDNVQTYEDSYPIAGGVQPYSDRAIYNRQSSVTSTSTKPGYAAPVPGGGGGGGGVTGSSMCSSVSSPYRIVHVGGVGGVGQKLDSQEFSVIVSGGGSSFSDNLTSNKGGGGGGGNNSSGSGYFVLDRDLKPGVVN